MYEYCCSEVWLHSQEECNMRRNSTAAAAAALSPPSVYPLFDSYTGRTRIVSLACDRAELLNIIAHQHRCGIIHCGSCLGWERVLVVDWKGAYHQM
ncbi:unnamed protein product, partial [Pylaiella littoralis]